MPWPGTSFGRHDHALSDPQARKGGKIATAMIARGIPEGEAIATGIARAKGQPKRPKTALKDVR